MVPHQSGWGQLSGLMHLLQTHGQELAGGVGDVQATGGRVLADLPHNGGLQADAQHGAGGLALRVGHGSD